MRQDAFLSTYRQSGVITTACKAIGISRETHYDWLETDPTYPERFESAKRHAAQALEEELYRRAVDEKSDTLLIFALKGAMPDKYRERFSAELTGKDGKPLFDVASIRAYIKQAGADGE